VHFCRAVGNTAGGLGTNPTAWQAEKQRRTVVECLRRWGYTLAAASIHQSGAAVTYSLQGHQEDNRSSRLKPLIQGSRAVSWFDVFWRRRGFTFIEIAVRLVFLAALLAPLGCSGRRVPVPAFAPDRAGQEALALYDRNKDGFLDADELKSCPALHSYLTSWDADKDGRLSGAEIAARITAYQSSRIGLSALAFQVTLDGQPLSGATVTLIPEKFFGDALEPAAGTSDARGVVSVATPRAEVPGAACGLYRIEVSKKDAFGRETISARYNQATILGLEVAPDSNFGALCFALHSSMRP
jgi:hypothetical protein